MEIRLPMARVRISAVLNSGELCKIRFPTGGCQGRNKLIKKEEKGKNGWIQIFRSTKERDHDMDDDDDNDDYDNNDDDDCGRGFETQGSILISFQGRSILLAQVELERI